MPYVRLPELPPRLQEYHPNADVGREPDPDDWADHIDRFTHEKILRLVIFYNDDFGILRRDNVKNRQQKLLDWLSHQV